MELIADFFLIAGALGVGLYCLVLSRRLTRFTDLEKGVGGAIAVLSKQVDDMTSALESASKATTSSADSLGSLTGRADGVAQKLELLVASLHDLPLDAAAGENSHGGNSGPDDEGIVTMFQSKRTSYNQAAE